MRDRASGESRNGGWSNGNGSADLIDDCDVHSYSETPTMEQLPPWLRGEEQEQATELTPPSSGKGDLYDSTCVMCGQVAPPKSGGVEDPPRKRISTMPPRDVDGELLSLMDEAQSDERKVLLFIARRLVAVGQRSYGPLDIVTDARNFPKERNEEIGDLLVYSGIEAIKLELKG